MFQRRFLPGFVLGLIVWAGGTLAAEPPALQPDHPTHYLVQPGDTLWSIASRFLRDPWRWREIWTENPSVENPHLIYPGDELILSYVDGQPRLDTRRGKGGMKQIKLTPTTRQEVLAKPIPVIPLDTVRAFLTRPRVLSRGDKDNLPYLVSFVSEHVVGGKGDSIYVRKIEDDADRDFDVVRLGAAYRDPATGEELGYEATFIGDAKLLRTGDPAKLVLTSAVMQAEIGDRVLPNPQEELLTNFYPKPAPYDLEGQIIGVLNGVSQIGQYNVVVLNKGSDDGLERGHILRIQQGGNGMRDRIARGGRGETITRPLEEAGTLMVFRVFERVSFGLVMHATSFLHVQDWVRSPDFQD